MTTAAFDFRKPPPGELGRQAARWLAAVCKRTATSWPQSLPFAAELSLGPIEVVSASVGLDAFPDDAVAIPITTRDSADGTVLLVFSRPVLLTLLAGLVGETPTALPDDRDLTELELSLTDFLARELFLNAFEKAWPLPGAPSLTPAVPAPPRAAWAGGEGDLSLFAQFNVKLPVGDHQVHLLVPRTGVWAKLGAPTARAKPAPAAPSEQIRALVGEMAVELTVVLGSAELTMRDLANLSAGDVVVLRQKVDRPLDGQLGGTTKYRVWPGVVGERVAVVIDAAAEAK
jgi:flagellar motor switch protein FliM